MGGGRGRKCENDQYREEVKSRTILFQINLGPEYKVESGQWRQIRRKERKAKRKGGEEKISSRSGLDQLTYTPTPRHQAIGVYNN